jgi:hypothetical protein
MLDRIIEWTLFISAPPLGGSLLFMHVWPATEGSVALYVIIWMWLLMWFMDGKREA